jgi:Bacterial regulatory helix-turn-helix protein, lysR family
MTLQQLRYFLALCEEQNFTRAAKRCGVSQPSLTCAIKELEAEFGGSLFVRSRRTSRLSNLGTIVRPHLAQIDRSAADAKREAADFLAARSVLAFKPKGRPMRKIIFGAAIAATLFIVADVFVRPLRPADASLPAQASGIADIYALEAAIDVKALPRQDILSEADE